MTTVRQRLAPPAILKVDVCNLKLSEGPGTTQRKEQSESIGCGRAFKRNSKLGSATLCLGQGYEIPIVANRFYHGELDHEGGHETLKKFCLHPRSLGQVLPGTGAVRVNLIDRRREPELTLLAHISTDRRDR